MSPFASPTTLTNLVDHVDARVRIVEDYAGIYSSADGVSIQGNSDGITVRVGADGRVWAHELGHGLGLGHRSKDDPDGNSALMWYKDSGSADVINDLERAAFED
jgi:hypothetical protein